MLERLKEIMKLFDQRFKEKMKWLDPFTYVDKAIMPILNPSNNQAIGWIVYVFFAFVFAWLLYSLVGFVLGTSSPIVVVVSPSMEPVYFRGDAIILQRATVENIEGTDVFLPGEKVSGRAFSEIGEVVFGAGQDGRQTAREIRFFNSSTVPVARNGSIVVYFSKWRAQPIIHRVVARIHAMDGVFVLTKGDSVNNSTIDQDCGAVTTGFPEKNCISLYPVPVREIQGTAFFRVPFVGCVKLWALDDFVSLLAEGRLPVHFNGIC